MDNASETNEDIPVIEISDVKRETMRSSGKGGQNVNKVETKVRLRFDIDRSAKLSDAQKERLKQQIHPSYLADGRFITVSSQTERSQKQNEEDALAKLNRMIAEALLVQKERIQSVQEPKSAKEKRHQEKDARSRRKEWRKKVDRGLDE